MEKLRSGEVDYTLDDFRALARVISPMVWRLSGILGWILLIGTIVAWCGSRLTNIPYDSVDALTTLALGAVLVFLGRPFVRVYVWRWNLRKNRLYAPQTFVAGEGAFLISSSTGELTLPWTSILSVKLADERLFVFITKFSAYIVPRRAFDRDEEFAKFAIAAEQYWKSKHAL